MDRSERGLAVGATGGGVIGAAVGGPVGAAVGAAAGGYTGHHQGFPMRDRSYPEGTYSPNGNASPPHYAIYDADVVRDAQISLTKGGYRPGAIDGMWGPNTENAVLRFQRANRLRETGVLDRRTLYALGVEP